MSSEFFKGNLNEIPKFARIVYPWDATKFIPNSTGIPSHVTLMADMEQLRCKFDSLIFDIKDNMQEIMY